MFFLRHFDEKMKHLVFLYNLYRIRRKEIYSIVYIIQNPLYKIHKKLFYLCAFLSLDKFCSGENFYSGLHNAVTQKDKKLCEKVTKIKFGILY